MKPKHRISLLIVDDHPVFRRGLRDIIEDNCEYNVVGEASEGAAALRLATELKPDITIVDIDMPQLNGLEMVRALKKQLLPIKVVFLTMYKDEDIFNAAMDLGIKAYVLKENAVDEIFVALKKVAQGEPFISGNMSDMWARRHDRVNELLSSMPKIDSLTAAERRILKLISEDHTSKEMANMLQISVKTIENHRQNICDKLNVHGSHSLLKFAFDHKLSL